MPHNEYNIERDSNFISGFGRATRIVSIHDQSPTKVRGEWYVVIDGGKPQFDMGSVEAEIRDSGINHKKLTNIMRNEADIRISSLLDEQMAESGARTVISYQHSWETVGESELIELWLPGRHTTAFKQITETTQCDPLKSIMVDVMRFPTLDL